MKLARRLLTGRRFVVNKGYGKMMQLTLGGKGKIQFEPDLMGKLVTFTQMQKILKGENGSFD